MDRTENPTRHSETEQEPRRLTDGGATDLGTELEHARTMLGDDVDAFYVGVVRDGEVDTTFAQRADDPEQEALQPLALLAAHIRLVANEAGVEPSTVAGDAATLAGQVEEIPASADAMPDDE